ncbi:hypothetical protein C8J30_101355 [Rhodobacter viridis]|uniref:Methyltransferase family protein n=1 Tax=Rhodobacter viridis TaxID=1054202 RepID=A0A318UAL4_9RHOB|nr:hypothetical protein [Rhodobacter viridis]PYF12971.1 hypothetical protein C8J30_101355 [Rhodobacter viridis]
MSPKIERPKLTLPEAEAAALTEAYASAEVILEYGSGGSTAMGAEMPGKRIFSVESDADWLAMMRGWFDAHPPKAQLVLHHGDIGPTKEWGAPKDTAAFRQWPSYPIGVWDRPDFVQPDLVLIDGRFRAACFLTTLFRITKPVRLLWDDYTLRPGYHLMESFCPPVRTIGRMAEFHLTPTAIPAEKLGLILTTYLRPN